MLTAVLLLGACGGMASIGPSRDAVARFHQQLDARQFERIWSEADDAFRGSTTREQALQLLDAIHRKLGAVVSSTERAWNVRSFVGSGALSGDFVQLTEDTTFERGIGAEDFAWKIVDGTPRLAGYHINSADLVTR